MIEYVYIYSLAGFSVKEKEIARMNSRMNLNIVCIPGDGIGPEIVAEAKKVLDKVAVKFGHSISYKDILMGGAVNRSRTRRSPQPRLRTLF